MISGIAFDRPDRLSHLRAFPYDLFKIYTIVTIVRIELNSIEAIEGVSIVRDACDCPGSVSIAFRSSEQTTGTGFNRSIEMKYSQDVFKAVQSTHSVCVLSLPIVFKILLKILLLLNIFLVENE